MNDMDMRMMLVEMRMRKAGKIGQKKAAPKKAPAGATCRVRCGNVITAGGGAGVDDGEHEVVRVNGQVRWLRTVLETVIRRIKGLEA